MDLKRLKFLTRISRIITDSENGAKDTVAPNAAAPAGQSPDEAFGETPKAATGTVALPFSICQRT
jgi:hypothetical protein